MNFTVSELNRKYVGSYLSLGWYVLPVHSVEDARCSCGNIKCGSKGKHPMTRSGVKDATTNSGMARQWWSKWPNANIAIATGKKSDIVVIDIDPRNGGDETLAKLINDIGQLPKTVVANTGGGGQHIYFKYPVVDIKGGNNKLGKGIDIKSDGGYVVAAPSVHASGEIYQWQTGCGPDDIEVAELPASIIQLLVGTPKKLAKYDVVPDVIKQGQRNSLLFQEACSLRAKGRNRINIETLLNEINETRCDPPLDCDELSKIVRSACKYEKGKTLPLHIWRDVIRSNLGPGGGSGASMRHILVNLSFYMNGDGLNCYPTQDDIADETGYTVPHVSKILKQAEILGWIKKVSHKGKGQAWRNLAYKPLLPRDVLLSEQHVMKMFCPDALMVLSPKTEAAHNYLNIPKNN